MLELCLSLLQFSLHVDEVAKRNGILAGANHEC